MNLTFEEFVGEASKDNQVLRKIFRDEYLYAEPGVGYVILNVVQKTPKKNLSAHFRSDHFDYEEIYSPHFYLKWEVSGASGGSCWGTDAEEYLCNASEPKFKILDSFLTKVYPNLTFLKYKEIEGLIKTDEISDNEYYGNRTDYMVKWLDLKELYGILKNIHANDS